MLLTSELERPVTNTTMINYSTRDFATKEQLELYLLRQEKAFSPEVIKLFTEAGMLRRAVTQIWNKEQSYRVGIVFEYRDQEAYKACQALLEEHYLPAVEGLTTKVVGSRGVVVHELCQTTFRTEQIAPAALNKALPHKAGRCRGTQNPNRETGSQ